MADAPQIPGQEEEEKLVQGEVSTEGSQEEIDPAVEQQLADELEEFAFVVEEGDPAPAPAEAQTDTVAEPKAEAETKVDAPAAETAPVPAAEAPKVEPEQPQGAKEATPTEPQDLNVQFKEFFDRSVEYLSAEVYKLSEQEKEILDTTPSQVLPQMMATLHMRVATAVTTQLANLIPSLSLMALEERDTGAELEKQFFDQWPALKEAAKAEEIAQVARMHQQMNPNADSATRIKEVGAILMVQKGLPIPTAAPAPQVDEVPQAVVPTSALGAGARAMQPRQPAAEDEWSRLVSLED